MHFWLPVQPEGRGRLHCRVVLINVGGDHVRNIRASTAESSCGNPPCLVTNKLDENPHIKVRKAKRERSIFIVPRKRKDSIRKKFLGNAESMMQSKASSSFNHSFLQVSDL